MFSINTNPDPTVSEQDWDSLHPSAHSKVKRLLDILGALVGLGITAIIFIPVAAAIKLDSPGPILFNQERGGLAGRPFRIWKFRSMVANAEALKSQVENQVEGAFFKNDQDPRITQVGQFLRRTSLDEFPQFWNVLKGDMSLVGTRPPTLDEVALYDSNAWQRLRVKPGITGLWQVTKRSEVRSFEEVLELDLEYQKCWTLRYDITILVKTVSLLFNRKAKAV